MNVYSREEQVFLNRLNVIVENNLSIEQFGVNELAVEMGMSRSNIHRRLKKINGQSVSQFIRTIRLEKAMEMLRLGETTASEIAYRVGFGSPTYFNRCFHEHFGYPPGEVKNRVFPDETELDGSDSSIQQNQPDKSSGKKQLYRNRYIQIIAALIIAFGIFWLSFNLITGESLLNREFSPEDNELSIVVLPFKNLSDNNSYEYFAGGITEDILHNLYWITSMRVVSRTSAEQIQLSQMSAPEIAKTVNAKYVLEGSVRIYDNKVRISAQLIDAHSDKHIWSNYYDREMNDIIGVQDEIALQVASALKSVLSENEIMLIEKIPTRNSLAYDYYLQARFLLHKANSEQRSGFDRKSVQNCIQYYEKAIAADSAFAEAYSGLANAVFNLSAWGWVPGGFQKAAELCVKALAINPECAEAHAILGAILVWGQGKFEEGGKELKTSLQYNPNFATVRQWYAQFLMITGPISEARINVNRALELEPYFWVVQNLNSWIYYFEEKFDKSLDACIVAHDYNPDFSSNDWLFVLNYARLGEGEKMVQKLQKIAEKYSGTGDYTDDIMQAFNKTGIDGLFYWLIQLNKNNPLPVEGMNGNPFYIAWWNAILGNTEETILWLQKAVEHPRAPHHYLFLIGTNPDFDFLRDDPRFLKIIDSIGLSSYHNPNAI